LAKHGGASGLLGKAGLVGAALAVGAAAGSAADDWDTKNAKYYRNKRTGKMEGGSDAMATQAFDAMTRLGLIGSGQKWNTEQKAQANAAEKGARLLELQARGGTLQGKEKGDPRRAITDELIKQQMSQVVGAGATPEMLSLLLRIAKASEQKRKLAVKLSPAAFGLWMPKVEEGRGPKQGKTQ
jgi:hypothetical protein